MPVRLQRSRAKGWQMPDGAIYVGRPTPWGNPFVVGVDGSAADCVESYRLMLRGYGIGPASPSLTDQAIARRYVSVHIEELRGKDLVCWCRLDQPCHADFLLKLANVPRCEEVA